MTKTVDVSIYRAIDPDMNMSIDEAKGLQKRLGEAGFPVERIACHPQGDGKGWGITGEVALEEVLKAGVPLDEPIHLQFYFFGSADAHVCALASQFFGAGGIEGVTRIYAAVNPGRSFSDALAHMFSVTKVRNAVEAALAAD